MTIAALVRPGEASPHRRGSQTGPRRPLAPRPSDTQVAGA